MILPPHFLNNVDMLEKIQIRMTKMIGGLEDRLKKFRMFRLEKRVLGEYMISLLRIYIKKD